MVELRDVHMQFEQKQVLEGVSLDVQPQERLVIMGQSGSGKSTILRLILGILRPDSGSVFFKQFEINRLKTEPPTDAELQGIKNYMTGIYVLQNSTRTGVIGQLENMNYNELDKNYIDSYIQKVNAVTPKDVQAMVQKYLSEDKMTIVVVGDKSKIAEQLKPYEN